MTPEQVRAIRQDYENGLSLVALTVKYKSAYTTVRNIVIRKSWKNI